MGVGDKIEHAVEKAGDKAMEAAGEVTDNDRLKAEGKREKAKAERKQAGD